MTRRNLFFVFFFLASVVHAGPPGVSQPPVWNPFGGHLQYLGPGNGLKEGEIYYMYQDGSNNVYWTFDGTFACFYVNSSQQFCFPGGSIGNFLLLEDGTFFLLEDGTKMVLE